MTFPAPTLDPSEARSLLGWWLDAGVDVAVAEEPRNWLAAPSPRTSAPLPPAGGAGGGTSIPFANTAASFTSLPTPQPPPAGGSGSHVTPAPHATPLPDTLEAFHAWLRESADLPLFRAGAARALPHGPATPEIMLVLGPPSAEDAADGRPLSGDAWALATRMLAAIGLVPDQAYVAALACFPSPMSRLAPADADACAAGMRRHIALVAPKRLLLMGDAAALAILGEPIGQARGRVHRLDGAPVVATFNPRHLLARPSDKAHAWRDLLSLLGETVS